jgi:hypothetical protein
MAEIKFTANSGALVQKATTVNQIIKFDIPNFFATLQAQSTKKFAQKISKINQIIINKYSIFFNFINYFFIKKRGNFIIFFTFCK